MSLSQTRKINQELEQIRHFDQQTMFSRRIEWANSRGKRLEFIKELNNRLTKEGVVGKVRSKMYSTAIAGFDKENMKMSWA